jgi:hypothetical protein
MSEKLQDSSSRSFDSELFVSNFVFIIFMLWLLFSKNQWGHFAFYLTVGNSWTDCTHNLSFLPQIKNHPSFLDIDKESVWFESFFARMLGGTIIYPTILLHFFEDDISKLLSYIIVGFICGVVFRKIVAAIFYYLIVLPTIILIRIVDCIATFLSRHKLIRRTSYALISCILILCIGFWLSPRIFPRRVASISSSSSQTQYREEPRQGEVVSKESDTVWIPTHGGTKYHRRSTCSGMEDPEKTTREDAIQRGFEPCQRCY